MAVQFPAWWPAEVRKQIVDIEEVGIELFRSTLPNAHGTNWLPTDEETHRVLFDAEDAFLRVFELPGELDLENNSTIHRVDFAAISNDGKDSRDILAFVQWTLYAYERASYVVLPDGAKVLLKFNGMTAGPILDPQQIRDARLARMTVELETPLPKGLLTRVKQNLGL